MVKGHNIRCKECGYSIHPKEKYCPKCGWKVYSWGKQNWIILGVLLILSAIANLFGYFYYSKGSFIGFVIVSLMLMLGYIWLWYENSPKRVASRREAAKEREHLRMIQKEEEAREFGRENAGRKIRADREWQHSLSHPDIEGMFGRSNLEKSLLGNQSRRRKRRR